MKHTASSRFLAVAALLLPALSAGAVPTVTNPSFEAATVAPWALWVGSGSNADGLERDFFASTIPDGFYVMGVKGIGAGGKGGYQYIPSGWDVNTNYRLSVQAKNLLNANFSFSIGYALGDAGSAGGPGATYGTPVVDPASAWTPATVDLTYNGGQGVTIYLKVTSGGSSERAGFDVVTITDLGPAGPTWTPTATRTATPTITPGGPTHTPTPPQNPTPFIPNGPVYGMMLVLGESIVSPGWSHDDKGPPMERVVQVYGDSRATCLQVGFTDWIRNEPNDPGSGPSTYDWTILHDSVDPFVPILPGRLGIAYAYFGEPPWLAGEYGTARYWTLAERFMEAFAREINRYGIYHFVFENEPNLLARPDWADYYMERLQHAYVAIKRADSRNVVIGGNLAERSASNGHFNILYNKGFKDYCDVVGDHPYSDQAATGIDIDEVKALHNVMASFGDGAKKIYLAEGWGPKRDVPGVGRGNAADRPNREEIDRLTDFMNNGYARIANPQPGYDPNWLLGAVFFTFNDNLGALHWADRATPVPNGCLIDGYFFEGCHIDPAHHNGGIIDFYGNAKRDLIWRFPDGTPRPSPTPIPVPAPIGPSVIQNGNFEGGFSNGVAAGWTRFDTTGTGKWESRAGRTGLAQAFGENVVGFNGGVCQSFATTPGQWYGIFAYINYDLNNANDPDKMIAIGWDVTGQTSSPRTMSIVWSQDYLDVGLVQGQWRRVEHQFQATSTLSSVWFWCGQEWAAPVFYMLVDDVEVRPISAPGGGITPTFTPGPATATPTRTPTLPGPTSTPTRTPTPPVATATPTTVGQAHSTFNTY